MGRLAGRGSFAWITTVPDSEEDGGSIAEVPDPAHCSAFGATPEEALAQVLNTRASWLEAARAEAKPIPPPRSRPAIDQVA
jgi:predicted RNase H-like HicB family nuclease